MPVVVHLLHDGVVEERHLRAVPMTDLGTIELSVHHRGARDIGGPAHGVSPLIEVPASVLWRGLAIGQQARAGARAAFDTVDDHARPGRAFLRMRADPASDTLVVRVVDLARARSRAGDWDEAPGSVRILAEDWLSLCAVGASVLGLGPAAATGEAGASANGAGRSSRRRGARA